MKKLTLLFSIAPLLLVGLFLPQSVLAQSQAQIVEQIINLPELQQHYPMNIEGTQKQVNIMQFPISFPSNLTLSNSEKDVVLMTKSEIEMNKVDAYFNFRSIKETQNTAKVSCNYFYNYNYSTKKANYFILLVDLQKSGDSWKIVNANVKGGVL